MIHGLGRRSKGDGREEDGRLNKERKMAIRCAEGRNMKNVEERGKGQ